MPPLSSAFVAGKRLGSPVVIIDTISPPSMQPPPTRPLDTSGGRKPCSKRRMSATPGPSQDDRYRSDYEQAPDARPRVKSGSLKKRRILRTSNGEDPFPRGRPSLPQFTNTGKPKMTEKERQFRWANNVRLSLRGLRLLRHTPHSVVPPRYRHEIAPYAFDEDNMPFSEYKLVKPEPTVGSEEAECIKNAFKSEAWNRGVERAASEAREGNFSEEAIMRATEIIHQTFGDEPENLECFDDEVHVVDPSCWELAALKKRHAQRFQAQDQRIQELESIVKGIQPTAALDTESDASEVNSTTVEIAKCTTTTVEHTQVNHDVNERSYQNRQKRMKQGAVMARVEPPAESSASAHDGRSPLARPALVVASSSKSNERIGLPQNAMDPNKKPQYPTRLVFENHCTDGFRRRRALQPGNACPNQKCQRLHSSFCGTKEEVKHLIPFCRFKRHKDIWLRSIRTIVDCGDEEFHSRTLIDECTAQLLEENTPYKDVKAGLESLGLKTSEMRHWL